MFTGDEAPPDPLVRHVVRVRATINPPAEGRTVYFRPFDVDDPSSATDPIDKNDGAGARGDG